MAVGGFRMSYEDLFKKFVKLKLVRNLRYEPHIVETIKYINPESFLEIFVFYKEINYLKPILLEHLDKNAIYDCDVNNLDKCILDKTFDCIIIFLCKNSSNQNIIEEKINKLSRKNTVLFVVDYILGNKLFNLALRLSDARSYNDIKGNVSCVFEQKYKLIDEYISKKNNISIKKIII